MKITDLLALTQRFPPNLKLLKHHQLKCNVTPCLNLRLLCSGCFQKQVVNTTLTYHHLLSRYVELVESSNEMVADKYSESLGCTPEMHIS